MVLKQSGSCESFTICSWCDILRHSNHFIALPTWPFGWPRARGGKTNSGREMQRASKLRNFWEFTFSIHFGPSPVTAFCTLSPTWSAFRVRRFQSILIIPCSLAISSKMMAPPIVNAAIRPTLADANPVTLFVVKKACL